MYDLIYFNGNDTIEKNYTTYKEAKNEFMKIYNSYDYMPEEYITLEIYKKDVVLCWWYPNGY